MKMWSMRMSGIADQPENLAAANFLAWTNAKTVRLQMSIESKAAFTQIKGHEIARCCLHRKRNGIFLRGWIVFRNAVRHIGDDRIGDGQDFFPISISICVRETVMIRVSVRSAL